MNRKWKFTGFVLASALLLGSTGTFLVGCKDYDDDISHLQQQIDANKKAIEGIEAQIKAGAILTKVESDGAGGVKVTLSNGQTYHIEKGAKGEDGAQGIQGPEGPQGPMGPKGDAPTFTINEEGEPVLIEANINGGSVWLFQMAHGYGAFGEDTAEVLRWLHKVIKMGRKEREKHLFGN